MGSCAAASSTSPGTLPDTPAGSQARWLVGAVAKAPLSTSEIEAHVDAALLAKLSPAHLNSTFVAFQSLSVDSVTSHTSSTIDVVVTVHAEAQLRVDLGVDAEGLIDSLQFLPVGATPTSVAPSIPSTWAGVEADFRPLAGIFVVSVLAENPRGPIAASTTEVIGGAVAGAFELAER